jgi:hypothetical protein
MPLAGPVQRANSNREPGGANPALRLLLVDTSSRAIHHIQP